MNFEQIILTLITASVPAAIAYFSAIHQSKMKLTELEENNRAELTKMKLEYELKLKEKETDSQNDLIMKMFTGDIDLDGFTNSMDKLDKISKKANSLHRSNFIKNR